MKNFQNSIYKQKKYLHLDLLNKLSKKMLWQIGPEK